MDRMMIDFIRLVEEMRTAQKAYFKTRDKVVLQNSKMLERSVDAKLAQRRWMLKWTDEPPTEPGWYFLKTTGKTSVRRVACDANGTLQVIFGPVRQAVRFMSQFGAQWAGPIEEPQEKEEA